MRIFPFILASILLFSGCHSTTSNPDSIVKKKRESSILFLGDTSFGENYQEKLKTNILETKGYDYPFRNFDSILQSVDLTIANLETPIVDKGTSPLKDKKKYIHWVNTEKTLITLLKHGIHTFILANNHSMDFGNEGLDSTLDSLQKYNMTGFGAGRTTEEAKMYFTYQWQNDLTLAVLTGFPYNKTYNEKYNFYTNNEHGGVNMLDSEELRRQIQEIHKNYKNPFIVVSPHWGNNYKKITKSQVDMAHKIIDAGADLIIGHGAHIAQQTEEYKGKWIIYNLGNFIFNSPGRYQKLNVPPISLIARLTSTEEEILLRLYPIFTDNLITNYQSRFVTKTEFQRATTIQNGQKGRDEYGYYMEINLSRL